MYDPHLSGICIFQRQHPHPRPSRIFKLENHVHSHIPIVKIHLSRENVQVTVNTPNTRLSALHSSSPVWSGGSLMVSVIASRLRRFQGVV